MHLKCIVITSNNVYLTYKVLCDFIQSNTKSDFSTKFWKNCNNSVPQQARVAKIISISCCKISIRHAKFFTIPCNRIRDRTTTRILGKAKQQNPRLSYMCPNCIIVFSNDIYYVYKFLCNFIHQKSRSTYIKFPEKV